MRDLILGGLVLAISLCSFNIGNKIDTLTQTLREKQIILKIDTLHWGVEAQKGSVVHLLGERK